MSDITPGSEYVCPLGYPYLCAYIARCAQVGVDFVVVVALSGHDEGRATVYRPAAFRQRFTLSEGAS